MADNGLFYGLPQGESLCILGAPGTGKSHTAGSICDVVPPERVDLIVCKPREASSYLYKKYGLAQRAKVFSDVMTWKPHAGKYVAGGWKRLLDLIESYYTDETKDAIILDPGTDAVTLLEHHLLAPNKVGSPADLGDMFAFYRQLKDNMSAFVELLVGLTVSGLPKSPKFVIVTWHVQPAKDETPTRGGGPGKPSADMKAEGVEFEGKVLPMIDGAYRRRLAADFGVVAYTDLEPAKDEYDAATKKMVSRPPRYILQVQADKERHAKIAGAPATGSKHIDNNFRSIWEMLKV